MSTTCAHAHMCMCMCMSACTCTCACTCAHALMHIMCMCMQHVHVHVHQCMCMCMCMCMYVHVHVDHGAHVSSYRTSWSWWGNLLCSTALSLMEYCSRTHFLIHYMKGLIQHLIRYHVHTHTHTLQLYQRSSKAVCKNYREITGAG